MTTIVVAHGAWSAGWAWKKMHPRLAAAGHTLVTPTYTGLGERRHLAGPHIDLETHVADLLGVLETEDLHGVALVAHSYGGMVGTAVADRARERIDQLIYLDAFVPADGQALADLVPPGATQAMRDAAAADGDGWRVPPNPVPADTAPEDLPWIEARRSAQPLGTFTQPLRIQRGPLTLPRAYIYCTRTGPGDTFGLFAAAAQADPAWRYRSIDASHSPHVTAPDALTALLDELVRT